MKYIVLLCDGMADYPIPELGGRTPLEAANKPAMDQLVKTAEVGLAKTDGKYIEIPDRREAIRWCIENAQPGDIIVLAGKGHEDYQEIEGKK